MTPEDRLQFLNAIPGAQSIADLCKALPKWPRESVIHFRDQLAPEIADYKPRHAGKPLPGVAVPKPVKKGAPK